MYIFLLTLIFSFVLSEQLLLDRKKMYSHEYINIRLEKYNVLTALSIVMHNDLLRYSLKKWFYRDAEHIGGVPRYTYKTNKQLRA